jgi:hypothetical protein
MKRLASVLPHLPSLLAAVLCLGLPSCADRSTTPTQPPSPPAFVNPHPPGTYAHFTAEPKYPKTHDVYKNHSALAQTNPENSHLVIDLHSQRGRLMKADTVVIDYPICSGRKSHPTPPGTYQILEKIVDKRSNKYGRMYNAAGTCINRDADITKDPVPEGGRFEGAPMNYWMRLTWDGIGHHVGPVLRYPASHACIRGPSAVMPVVYSKVKVGTKVIVQ